MIPPTCLDLSAGQSLSGKRGEKKTTTNTQEKKQKHKRSARGVNVKQGADLPAASHSGSS